MTRKISQLILRATMRQFTKIFREKLMTVKEFFEPILSMNIYTFAFALMTLRLLDAFLAGVGQGIYERLKNRKKKWSSL